MSLRAIPPKTSTGTSKRKIGSSFGIRSIGLNIGNGCRGRISGSPGQTAQRKASTSFKPRIQAPKRKPIEEKVDIEKIKTWIIKELAAIMELEGLTKKNSMEKKKQFLLGCVPEFMIKEIMRAAKKLSREPQG